ncbi:hypothetical protein BKA83DRAFT_4125090 [Pisolithus microcarpus]|nr:hypothetical protein BKA83DRAFT_4125090 [Pisolithus microcarpus]
MATDALKLDEENIHGEHPSHMVSLIMDDDDNKRKLNLNLAEFAVNMFKANEDHRLHTECGAQNLPNVCQVPGHTPNAHSSQTPAPPPAYGGGIPSSHYGMLSQLPFRRLSLHMHIHTRCYQWDNPPLHIPLGMNPQHAAMIQNSGDQGGCQTMGVPEQRRANTLSGWDDTMGGLLLWSIQWLMHADEESKHIPYDETFDIENVSSSSDDDDDDQTLNRRVLPEPLNDTDTMIALDPLLDMTHSTGKTASTFDIGHFFLCVKGK